MYLHMHHRVGAVFSLISASRTAVTWVHDPPLCILDSVQCRAVNLTLSFIDDTASLHCTYRIPQQVLW